MPLATCAGPLVGYIGKIRAAILSYLDILL
jgi:hypothetical protein